MVFKRKFRAVNPTLSRKHSSEQYDYVQKILEYKYKHDLSVREMAELVGLDLQTYLRLEFIDLDEPIETYQKIWNILEEK